MKRLKNIIKYLIGYETEYTKREMALFTRTVLLLLLFNIPLFIILYVSYLIFGMSGTVIKIFWTNYLGFCKILITGYSVTFIGQMGKAYMSKKSEEENKLQQKLNKLKQKVADDNGKQNI